MIPDIAIGISSSGNGFPASNFTDDGLHFSAIKPSESCVISRFCVQPDFSMWRIACTRREVNSITPGGVYGRETN
jgi:hypothetical protein